MDYLVRFGARDLGEYSVELEHEPREPMPWSVVVNKDKPDGGHVAVFAVRAAAAPTLEQCAWITSWFVDGLPWWPGRDAEGHA